MNNKLNTYLSLAFFLVLLGATTAYYIVVKNTKKKEYALTLFFANDGIGYLSGDSFSVIRQYKIYKLTVNANTNKVVLNNIKSQINAIKQNKDTIHGLDIVLDDSTSYQDFINAVDINMEKRPRAFAPYKNHIYAMYIDTTR